MGDKHALEPAFPRNYSSDGHNGMSLRDYFAGQALPAIVKNLMTAARGALDTAAALDSYSGSVHGYAAKIAYQYADAMLAERDK